MSPLDFHDPLCAAKAPSTAPELSRGLGASETHRSMYGLVSQSEQKVQPLFALRGLGVCLSPESDSALLWWTRGPCLHAPGLS